MYSMTGYGKSEYNENGLNVVLEIKSVNNRNLDLSCKLPRLFTSFEDLIRKAVREKVKRGRVDVFLNYVDTRERPVDLKLDLGLAKSFYEAGETIAKHLNIENDVTVSYLLKNPDVLKQGAINDDLVEFEPIISNLINNALDNFNAMREVEGDKLVKDMLLRVETISGIVDEIQKRAPLVVEDYRQKLKNRIEEALKDVKYDEVRLLNEVAFFTDRANIDEEITRLRSHIAQFKEIVKTVGAGKQLDFLIQEFNRESNTICSKANDIDITNFGLQLKCEIEKIREQVQNLE